MEMKRTTLLPSQELTPNQARALGLTVPEGTEKVLLYGARFAQFVQPDPEKEPDGKVFLTEGQK
jgi:hypothetical protein